MLVADRFLDPALRPDALGKLTAVSRALLADGGPGVRLAATRTLIDSAVTPGDVAVLRGWYGDGAIPGAAELDQELRWKVLLRLAVLGGVGAEDVDAELERDPSGTGQEGAARCRAALPDAGAKAAAWESMFHDDGLSNYLLAATAQGFWHPEQEGLLGEFVPRFYADAVVVAARRGPAIADVIGRHAFPTSVVTEESLRLGRAALTDPDLTPALHRGLADRLDDLARALRIRATHPA
jgi:aminopeptidase N